MEKLKVGNKIKIKGNEDIYILENIELEPDSDEVWLYILRRERDQAARILFGDELGICELVSDSTVTVENDLKVIQNFNQLISKYASSLPDSVILLASRVSSELEEFLCKQH